MKRIFAAAGLAAALCGPARGGEQVAVYRATGSDARLFEQYDNDGYSLEIAANPDGSLEMTVRVSDAPLASVSPFPVARGDVASEGLAPAPERDAFARAAVEGSRTQVEAVRRLLLQIAREVQYDPDRLRMQDPAAVFTSRKAYCVGFAELAVDLLRRVGISARTVQGILRTGPEDPAFDSSIGGAYHRWIEVYYPDRGFVFSDPHLSVNGVDARYVPFSTRALTRPKALHVTALTTTGELRYDPIHLGDETLRVRAVK
ncbi:MAG TPA: transglutaminase-like domain-containing protein [Thermoanaerobaculia bacterium]